MVFTLKSEQFVVREQLLKGENIAQAAVLPVDWPLYLSQIPPTVKLPLLQNLVKREAPKVSKFLSELRAAAPSTRLFRLRR